MKIYGIVPARMDSSRFPGKPLFLICGRPMIEHVFLRAKMFANWDGLYLATCDSAIEQFGQSKHFPVVMTAHTHVRCLDRVAEAIEIQVPEINETDIVVCVQGDEPMLHPNMIDETIKPLLKSKKIHCTVLTMPIVEEAQFINPDTVKIIHDMKGNVLYTSRSPVPYCKKFSQALEAKRIYGIFAFRWHFLKTFNQLNESPLEIKESCDSNRIIDHGFKQRIAPYPYHPHFSVDSPFDVTLVEKHIQQDILWGLY